MVNSCTAIIQARMGSERFYGKVLKPLPFNSNFCILDQIISRVKAANVEQVIVATSNQINDNEIFNYCQKKGYLCFRGDEENVLKRFYDTAKYFNSKNIIRITGDNPCIDPKYLKISVDDFFKNSPEYFATRGLPLGTNFEIFTFAAFEKCYLQAKEKYDIENVTPYFYNNTNIFKVHLAQYDFDKKEIRLTVDTKADYMFMCVLYDYLYPHNNMFGLNEILKLFLDKPYIFDINNNIAQKRFIANDTDELKYALEILEPYHLKNAEKIINKEIKY